MADTTKDEIRSKVEAMIQETQVEVNYWCMGREGLPFPDFAAGTRPDQAWQAGLAEGKEIGRLRVLKEILATLTD
jgi:hypothetical protein